MTKRRQALKRILLTIPLIFLVYLSAFLFYLVFIPYFLIDVILQLVTGGEGLPSSGLASNVYGWTGDNTQFVLFGKGEWSWSPQR